MQRNAIKVTLGLVAQVRGDGSGRSASSSCLRCVRWPTQTVRRHPCQRICPGHRRSAAVKVGQHMDPAVIAEIVGWLASMPGQADRTA